MPDKKNYVFSARTAEEGLRVLNNLRRERYVGWDELVIGAVCTQYGLVRAVMAIPRLARAKKAAKDRKPRKAKAKEVTSEVT